MPTNRRIQFEKVQAALLSERFGNIKAESQISLRIHPNRWAAMVKQVRNGSFNPEQDLT